MHSKNISVSTRCKNIASIFALLTMIASVVLLPTALAAPGDLDTSFGAPNGFVLLPEAQFVDVALQSDGKIVAVGSKPTAIGNPPLIVARFNPDGSIDPSFGFSGVVTVTPSLEGRSVAIQADGKILALSQTDPGGNFLVTRLNTNGTLDLSFGLNGSRTIDFDGGGDVPQSIAIGPGGTIVVMGTRLFSNDQVSPPIVEIDVAVARLLSNGSLDPSFGSDGTIATEPGFGADLALLPDGRIIVANFIMSDFAAMRYNANGTLDTTFGGGDGIATADIAGGLDAGLAVAVQPDGRVIVAGNAEVTPILHAEALARFDANGILDPSFGGDGKITSSQTFQRVTALAVTLQADGDIITVGNAGFGVDSSDVRAFLSRYTSSGTPDTSFGGTGTVFTDFPGNATAFPSLALQNDGKIVIVGDSFVGSPLSALGLVARYNGDGTPPPPPPPPPVVFDICVENGPLKFRFNSNTGAYEFRDCGKNLTIAGTGTVTKSFCKIRIEDGEGKNSGRLIDVSANTCTRAATAMVKLTNPAKTYNYSDSDITSGNCTCP